MSASRLLLLLIALAASVPAFAQGQAGGSTCDMSGEWSARSREDYEDRALLGTHLGDYTGFPINDAARQLARTWDASILSLTTQQALPHPPQYIMRGPGPNFRMTKFTNEEGEVVGYKLVGVYGRNDRTIWTDGRSHPPDFAEYTWDGFSTAVCERGMLKVTTTHMKYGYHRRNGVPASVKSKLTEYFIRRDGVHLTHIQFTEDPVYLDEPLVRTTDFMLNPTQNVGPRGLGFEIVDEIVTWPKGYVPSFPLDTLPTEFADDLGLPFEATQGGKETIYPEYLIKLRKMMSEMKSKQ
jgi:hypothetical protein